MNETANKIVDKMYLNDPFSQWLGIKILEKGKGISVLQMTIRKEMLNGFDVLHGGITYSLADSALAFSSNAHGKLSMSIETSISHVSSCKVGDVLTATTEEVSLSNKIGVYHIKVTNQDHKTVALFKGMVYRTSKDWEV
jgi:acyl-CoA thioesterase